MKEKKEKDKENTLKKRGVLKRLERRKKEIRRAH